MRLDQQRQDDLEPKRIASTQKRLEDMGCHIVNTDNSRITFIHNKITVMFYPYSGWFSAKKPICSGRGFRKLLKQLNKSKESK